jgi:AraC-like DNA-binding protein
VSTKFLAIDDWHIAAKNFNYSPQKAADFCGLTRRHFYRLFIGLHGKPAKQWMQEARIRRVKALLESGVFISEVAEDVGFNSEQAFNRFFSHHVGMPPHEFAKKPANVIAEVPFGTKMSRLVNKMSHLVNKPSCAKARPSDNP